MKTKTKKAKKAKKVKPVIIEPLETVETLETIEDQAEARYQKWKSEDDHLITIEDYWETGPDFISRYFYYSTDDPGDEREGKYLIWIQEGKLMNSVVTWEGEE